LMRCIIPMTRMPRSLQQCLQEVSEEAWKACFSGASIVVAWMHWGGFADALKDFWVLRIYFSALWWELQ
jgi:hypothetical protein